MMLILAFASLFAPFLNISTTTLFNFAASMTAILFILVAILIFVFVYDNLRRGKATAPT